MEVSGQLHAPAALPQGKSFWYPFHWISVWVGPRAGLAMVAKRKNSYSCQFGIVTTLWGGWLGSNSWQR